MIMAKQLMKGNEAIAEAAIMAGCRFFYGYPITPQNQIPEYMSKRLPQVGGCFLQAESEVAAINMVYGAAAAGVRVMTSSSSPGISLKQEGISYLIGSRLPCVIVNIMRGGPGLGSIQPAQSDYFQSVKGGGHGDYRMPVLAPASVGEAVELTQKAFALADQYRMPVLLLGDGMLGQMMEPVELIEDAESKKEPEKPWAANGQEGRPRNVINSLYMDPSDLERHNLLLHEQYREIERDQVRYEEIGTEDAEIVLVAYGTTARIAQSAMRAAREKGLKVGLLRPITLWPFPEKALLTLAEQPRVKAFMSIELSMGQMVEDVRLATQGKKPVGFFGRSGGVIPSIAEVVGAIEKCAQEVSK